jgi:hypothetical protein
LRLSIQSVGDVLLLGTASMTDPVLVEAIDALDAQLLRNNADAEHRPHLLRVMAGASVDPTTARVIGCAVTCQSRDTVCDAVLTPLLASGVSLYAVTPPNNDSGPDRIDAAFAGNINRLHAAAPQSVGEEWDLNAGETQRWLPSLGSDGFVKVLKYTDVARHTTLYFICVRAHLHRAATQYAAKIQRLSMTYAEVLGDTDWDMLLLMSDTNRDRLAAAAASELQCTLNNVRIDSRLQESVGEEGARVPVPTASNRFNVFRAASDGSSTVTFYNNCACTEDADAGIIVNGPTHMRWLHGHINTRQDFGGGPFTNDYGNAIPLSTGTLAYDQHVALFEHMDDGVRRDVQARYVWESRASLAPAACPSLSHGFSPAFNQFLTSQCGWELQNGSCDLQVVMGKVAVQDECYVPVDEWAAMVRSYIPKPFTKP